MKKKDKRNSSVETVNPGWKKADEWYLQKHDNTHEPDIQIFSEDNFEDDNKEHRILLRFMPWKIGLLEEYGHVLLSINVY